MSKYRRPHRQRRPVPTIRDPKPTAAQMADLMRDLSCWFVDAVQSFAANAHRWAISRHAPHDAFDDGTLAICLTCDTEWPCDEFVRLDQLEIPTP